MLLVLLLLLVMLLLVEVLMTTAEELSEDVVEPTTALTETTTAATTTATLFGLLETFLTLRVINLLLLRILEDFICSHNFSELLLCIFSAVLVLIRMILQGHLLKALLYRRYVR